MNTLTPTQSGKMTLEEYEKQPTILRLQERDRLEVELSKVDEVCRKYQEKQKIYHHANRISEKLETIIREYEDIASEALGASKAFRDRMVTHFRAFSMVLEMVGNASTHREKNARLRGCIELVETAIDRLEKERFDISLGERPRFDFAYLYRSDFPYRHYIDKIRELEGTIAMMTKPEVKPSETKPEDGDNIF